MHLRPSLSSQFLKNVVMHSIISPKNSVDCYYSSNHPPELKRSLLRCFFAGQCPKLKAGFFWSKADLVFFLLYFAPNFFSLF